MTNKQTIDGVSRKLLKRILANFVAIAPYKTVEIEELRALLDKPVTSDFESWRVETGEQLTKHEIGLKDLMQCAYDAVPSAQPQGEVERLRRLVDSKEVERQQCIEECSAEVGALRAQLAERDALLRQAEFYITRNAKLRNAIDDALSASAEPKPRGESVAIDENREFAKWMHETVEFIHHGDKVSKIQRRDIVELSEEEWAFEAWKGRAKLSAGQPPHSGDANEMVAKVVLPFTEKVIRKLQRFQECMDDGQGADIGRHWFDLLTQLGILNRVQRSPALWEITQQGEDALEVAKLNALKP